MTEIEISKYKPLIFVFGVLSLVLPWFYRINFLGIFITFQNISIIILDLLYFGIIYLIGLCFNFTFFKYNGQRNYMLGYLSWCLTLLGIIGYWFILVPRIVAYQEATGQDVVIDPNFGYLFAWITWILITVELFKLRKEDFGGPKEEVKKEKEEKKEKKEKKITKFLPFIITKPLIGILGILSLFFYWNSFPKGYESIKPYMGILWMLIIIFIIGFSCSFSNIKKGKIWKSIGDWSVVLIYFGYFCYVIILFVLLIMLPNVATQWGLGIIFAGIILILIAFEFIYIAFFKKG